MDGPLLKFQNVPQTALSAQEVNNTIRFPVPTSYNTSALLLLR